MHKMGLHTIIRCGTGISKHIIHCPAQHREFFLYKILDGLQRLYSLFVCDTCIFF